eukprot:scaffold110388_cov18-Tisochrysis_lutea.AAC.1
MDDAGVESLCECRGLLRRDALPGVRDMKEVVLEGCVGRMPAACANGAGSPGIAVGRVKVEAQEGIHGGGRTALQAVQLVGRLL